MAETKNLLLEKFRNRQSEKDTVIFQQAMRLVNQYRSLSYFGNDFVDQYNQTLLNASPAVKRLLGTFMGGEEVEDYLEFLQQNFHLQGDEGEHQKNVEIKNKGYLPEPDADMDIGTPGNSSSVSSIEWEQMKADNIILKEQVQLLLKELGSLKQKPVTGSLGEKVPSASPVRFSQPKSAGDNYSEIIEESGEGKAHE